MDSEQRQINDEINDARERLANDVQTIGASADVVGNAKRAVHQKVEDVRDALGDTAENVSARARDAAGNVSAGARDVGDSIRAGSPIPLLAVGLAIGILIGFLLPVSRD